MSLPKSLINWYGGKNKLARQIISIMPEHEHYVEVFMGGGAVFFQKPKSKLNTINDLNSNLVNLYIQVRDHHEELLEKCYWTLRSREEYRKFYKLYQNDFKDIDGVTKAMMYLFLVQSSFSTQLQAGYSASVSSNSASFNLDILEKIKMAREKLDGVVIENLSFEKLIPKFDRDTTTPLLYIDPPYYITSLQEGKKYYEKVMSKHQHEVLCSVLTKYKKPWILSYDDLPEVVDMYKDFNIFRINVKYSAGKVGKNKQIDELLITNFRSKKPQLDIFDESLVEIEDVQDEEKIQTSLDIKLKSEKELEEKLKEPVIVNRPESAGEQGALFD